MDLGRRCLAEFIGTFALVFVGVGSVIVGPDNGGNLLTIALAFGFVVAVMVSATLHISGGQFNPAVSIALAATGKMPARDAGAYIVVQIVAATVAAFVLRGLFGAGPVGDGTPKLGPTMGPMQGVVMEMILTFVLVFVIFATAVDKRGPNLLAGLLIGLTVTLDILFGGPYTGASMNPARSLGPALASGVWVGHWVYWVGPILGGVIAAVVYNTVYLAAPKASLAPAPAA